MKKLFLIFGVMLGLAGCRTHECRDGYSFTNDPANPDVLAPVLGLDPEFPPAPLPFYVIDP